MDPWTLDAIKAWPSRRDRPRAFALAAVFGVWRCVLRSASGNGSKSMRSAVRSCTRPLPYRFSCVVGFRGGLEGVAAEEGSMTPSSCAVIE